MSISSNTQLIGADDFDPMTPSNLQEPFVFFAKLRQEKPVYWNEQYSFWMFTQYRDVKALLRAPRQFSSATGIEIDKRAEQIPPCVRANFDIGRRFSYTHLQAADPHFCLGAALARLETQVALSRLLERIPQVQLGTRHFEYRPRYFLRSLKSLPIIIRSP